MQIVTPYCQYYMMEENGYRRGGCIRNLDEFYKSDFYLLPQEKEDTLSGLKQKIKAAHFIRVNKMCMVLEI